MQTKRGNGLSALPADSPEIRRSINPVFSGSSSCSGRIRFGSWIVSLLKSYIALQPSVAVEFFRDVPEPVLVFLAVLHRIEEIILSPSGPAVSSFPAAISVGAAFPPVTARASAAPPPTPRSTPGTSFRRASSSPRRWIPRRRRSPPFSGRRPSIAPRRRRPFRLPRACPPAAIFRDARSASSAFSLATSMAENPFFNSSSPWPSRQRRSSPSPGQAYPARRATPRIFPLLDGALHLDGGRRKACPSCPGPRRGALRLFIRLEAAW